MFEHRLHDGAAATRVQWYFREHCWLPVAVQLWQVPPGGSEGMHRHSGDDSLALEELYVLISGRAVMTVDEVTYDLAPGDAVRAPVDSFHDVRNPDEHAVAQVLVIFGEPGTPIDWSTFVTGRMSERAGTDQAGPAR